MFMLEILPVMPLQTLSAVGSIEKPGLNFRGSVAVILILVSPAVLGGVKRIGGGGGRRKGSPKAGLYAVFGVMIIMMPSSRGMAP